MRQARDDLRVVIAHDFTETYGGAERIAAVIAGAFPSASIHSILGRPDVAARMGVRDRLETVIPPRARVLANYRALAPLYPAIVASHRLPEADLLVTSSYAFAHGFRTQNDAPQLCYCYSPLRFAWSMAEEYGGELVFGRVGRTLMHRATGPFRCLDRRAASRVEQYVAESKFVARQIREFYGRDAEVLYPPVDTELFVPSTRGDVDDFFLFCGRLIEPYKRPTLAVEAFNGLPHRLLVVGDGPEYARLKALAGPNIEFAGHLDDEALIPLMQRCIAAVFPSRDDFGLIPVEVAACGRPTIAFAGGGALETVAPGVSGEFFGSQDVEALRSAVSRFRADEFDPTRVRAHAEGWSRDRFEKRFLELCVETAAAGPH